MKWRFVAVGKPSLKYASLGLEEYLKRLNRYARAELVTVRRDPSGAKESERLLKASEGCYRIAFDERGEICDTRALVAHIDALEMDGRVKEVAVLIGGAGGHDEKLRAQADLLLSFGKLTLQHELALVAAAEQIYRVYTIKRGEPYHR